MMSFLSKCVYIIDHSHVYGIGVGRLVGVGSGSGAMVGVGAVDGFTVGAGSGFEYNNLLGLRISCFAIYLGSFGVLGQAFCMI